MPKNMSFSITTNQFKNKTKTVTRRLGWWNLRPGDVLNGVEKAMGLKRGEKIKRLGQIRIISAQPEELCLITKDECVLEGFPEFSPADFVDMFCKHNKCHAQVVVNRIEFVYI